MGRDMIFTRLLIGEICLEMDINNEPRIVMKDELGQEWVLGDEMTSHGPITMLKKKEESFYFNEKNRTKPVKGF